MPPETRDAEQVNKPKAEPDPPQNPSLGTLLSRMNALEESNRELKNANLRQKEINRELKNANLQQREINRELEKVDERQTNTIHELEKADERQTNTIHELEKSEVLLKETIRTLDGTLKTTMKAVLGDMSAINQIRNRVLLDYGRDILARLCGYNSWNDWKVQKPSKDSLYDSAYQYLTTSKDLDPNWKVIGRQSSALKLLLHTNTVRDRGDSVAHTATQASIGESVLGLMKKTERDDMIAIFKAVYGVEPRLNS